MSRKNEQVSRAIVTRAIPFSFDENIPPVWNKQWPEWSHIVNGISLTMPYLEPFLIRSVHGGLKTATDESVKKDIVSFAEQEGNHFRNHRRYNDILLQNYPHLAEYEKWMDAEYKRFNKKSLRWRMAYTAGFETMIVGMADWLIDDRVGFFKDADPSVSSFILWHMVEETEHKNVAFDVYQHTYGDYLPRVWGLIHATYHFNKLSFLGARQMLEADGLWGKWRTTWNLLKLAARSLVKMSPAMTRSLFPGYHPDKENDSDWVDRWINAYAGLDENVIPLLDTSKPDIPAQFTEKTA